MKRIKPSTYKKRKHRRSVSMKRQSYERLRLLSEQTSTPMSAIIDRLIAEACDEAGIAPDPVWRAGAAKHDHSHKPLGGVFQL